MILFSSKGKHMRPSDRKYMHTAVPLLLGMLICMSALTGATWAWFSGNTTASVQLIQSAEYSLAVDVKYTEGGTENTVQANELNSDSPAYSTSYSSLEAEKTYIVTLMPTGSATSGYGIIAVDGRFYYTDTISSDGMTFTYQTGLPTVITTPSEYDDALKNYTSSLQITWYWGTYPNTQGDESFPMDTASLLSDADVIGNELTIRPEEKATPPINLTDISEETNSSVETDISAEIDISEETDISAETDSSTETDISEETDISKDTESSSLSVNEENATLSLILTDIRADKESGSLTVNTDYVISLIAEEGYTLPESITVDGVVIYTYENGVLTIPADQITDGTEIAVTAAGDSKQAIEE